MSSCAFNPPWCLPLTGHSPVYLLLFFLLRHFLNNRCLSILVLRKIPLKYGDLNWTFYTIFPAVFVLRLEVKLKPYRKFFFICSSPSSVCQDALYFVCCHVSLLAGDGVQLQSEYINLLEKKVLQLHGVCYHPIQKNNCSFTCHYNFSLRWISNQLSSFENVW